MNKEEQCWEHMKCKVHDDCPAYPNSGRSCFSRTGTLCRGETQGTYADKKEQCRECDFYNTVLFNKEN